MLGNRVWSLPFFIYLVTSVSSACSLLVQNPGDASEMPVECDALSGQSGACVVVLCVGVCPLNRERLVRS